MHRIPKPARGETGRGRRDWKRDTATSKIEGNPSQLRDVCRDSIDLTNQKIVEQQSVSPRRQRALGEGADPPAVL